MRRNKIRHLLLILILLFSIFLRVWGIGEVFKSSDEIGVQSAVIQYFPRSISSFNFLDETKEVSNPVGLFLHGHNVAPYLLGLITFCFYMLFKIPLTEFLWNLSSALMGTLSVLIVYLLVRFLFDEDSALISSLFIGLLPMHVYPSRFIGISHLFLDFFFLTLTLYLFCRFFKDPSRKNAVFSSISLAFYMLASMIFPLIFILIFFICLFYLKEKKKGPYPVTTLFKDGLRGLFRLDLLFAPILVCLFLLTANVLNLVLHGSLLGVFAQVFYSHNSRVGLHLSTYLQSSAMVINYTGLLVLAICFVILIKNYHKLKRTSILLAWFMIYSSPFLLIFSREPWTMAPYLLPAFGAAIILMAVILSNLNRLFRKEYIVYSNMAKYVLIFVVAISFFLGDLSFVFGVNPPGMLYAGNYGNYGGMPFPILEDFGVKAAGYWIRANTDNSAVLFSDYYRGGSGIEPPVADYYFHRDVYCIYDGNVHPENNSDMFDKVKDKIDFIILDPEKIDCYNSKIEGFYNIVNITDNGKIKLMIYAKKPYNFTSLPIKEGNDRYDASFLDFKSMTDCPKCNSARLIATLFTNRQINI